MPRKIQMERDTVEKMISIYCKGKHKSNSEVCSECRKLINYSKDRLENCRLGADKPACGRCKIHCYIPEMRAEIIDVMRYSGPKMLVLHPIMTFYHFKQLIRR